MLGRMPRFTTGTDGVVSGPPGAAYQIQVTLREQTPSRALRVVRASIAGVEINEQCIVGASRHPVTFLGWLESADGTKRLKFVFPEGSGEELIQVRH